MCYHYGSFCSAEYKRTETLQCQPDSGTATDAPKLLAKRAKHAADGTSALPDYARGCACLCASLSRAMETWV